MGAPKSARGPSFFGVAVTFGASGFFTVEALAELVALFLGEVFSALSFGAPAFEAPAFGAVAFLGLRVGDFASLAAAFEGARADGLFEVPEGFLAVVVFLAELTRAFCMGSDGTVEGGRSVTVRRARLGALASARRRAHAEKEGLSWRHARCCSSAVDRSTPRRGIEAS